MQKMIVWDFTILYYEDEDDNNYHQLFQISEGFNHTDEAVTCLREEAEETEADTPATPDIRALSLYVREEEVIRVNNINVEDGGRRLQSGEFEEYTEGRFPYLVFNSSTG